MPKDIFEQVKEFLISKVNPSFIMVFGSFANGTTHMESDIDIAFFKKDQSFSSYEVFMLAQELADLLNMEVDLVDLKYASTVFQAQIFSTGKVIFSNDEILRMNMEMTAFSMYAKLNEERKEIIENIDESGSIYENDVILNKISVIERCNIAVHDYQTISLDILQQIIDKHLEDFTNFTKQVLKY